MKFILNFIAVCFLSINLFAQQNHVYNGNFEQYTQCPNVTGLINKATGWDNFNLGTADYHNSCHSGTPSGVPLNYFGHQPAASGNGYIGLIEFTDPTNKFREYVTSYMTPLQVGRIYEVSMSVSVSNRALYFDNGLGVYFYDTGMTLYQTGALLDTLKPQVTYTHYGQLSDTVNWLRLTDTLRVDSAYDHIVIGGFFDTANLSYTATNFPNPLAYGYLFIDSVVVKLAKRFDIFYNETSLCAGDTINVPYFVVTNPVYFLSNNVFTLQLSDSSGSFANPVNIGTKSSNVSDTIRAVIPANTITGGGYRIRLISSNASDTSFDNGVDIGIGAGAPSKPVAYNNSPLCVNDTLKLTAYSSTSGVSYNWTGPGNFSSGLQSPSIPNPVPANSGDYIVTASVYACESKDTTTAVINSGAGATGTSATTNAPVCAGDTLRLFGTATGSSISYSWTGPGNFTSNQQNPVVSAPVVSMSGSYVVYANNGVCVTRDTVEVAVKPRPANFTATSNSPLCPGANINFTAYSSSTGVTYAWSGPNGYNDTGSASSIGGALAAHTGDYYVVATLNGCSLQDTLALYVKPLPAKPVAGSNSPLCAGETLNLTLSNTVTGVSYDWSGPGNYTSTQQNPVISNTSTSASGNYIVTATLNGCVNKDTAIVQVKPLPVQTTTNNSGPVCAGDSLFINIGASTTGVTYTWFGPNNFSATTQNTFVPNTTISATGWYVATVDLNGCSFKDSTLAIVHPIPQTPVVVYNNPLCVGETLNLNATGSSSGVTYSWTGTGNFTSTQQSPARTNIQLTDTGIYSVTATANGCTSAEGSVSVSINPVPFVAVSIVPGDTICAGDKATFTALPNNYGGTPVYTWLVNGAPAGVSGTTFSSTTLNNGDVVRCDMKEFTKCSNIYTDTGNDQVMKVLPWLAPTVSITANPNRVLEKDEYVTFTASVADAGIFPKYQWKRNGININGATSNVWGAKTLNDNDSISVEIVSDYKCPQPSTAVSNSIVVRVNTGIRRQDVRHDLVLYPNPNKGVFTINGVVTTNEPLNLTVLNIIGQVVYTKRIIPSNGLIDSKIDIGTIVEGIYNLKISNGQITDVIRFTVK